MPEGPVIRRAADHMAAAVVGEPLRSAWFAFPALKPYEAKLQGRRIDAIVPHGKALLTRFDHGWTLYSHNQLYGVWKIALPGDRADTTRSLRVALETERSAILLYSASDIEMWRSDEIRRHPFLIKLGPDVLDPALTPTMVAARLRDPRFSYRRRDIRAPYASEGIHQRTRPLPAALVSTASRTTKGQAAAYLGKLGACRLSTT